MPNPVQRFMIPTSAADYKLIDGRLQLALVAIRVCMSAKLAHPAA